MSFRHFCQCLRYIGIVKEIRMRCAMLEAEGDEDASLCFVSRHALSSL